MHEAKLTNKTRARPRRTKTRRRAERTGRRQPPRRWQPTTGSQPRPDVQEGRPPTAPTRTAEAQARGQRAEHQSARPSAVLAPSRVQRRGVEARRVVAPCVGARSVSDEPGERPERRVSAARYPVTNYLDTDGLSLVVLSCGVQEGRPSPFSGSTSGRQVFPPGAVLVPPADHHRHLRISRLKTLES